MHYMFYIGIKYQTYPLGRFASEDCLVCSKKQSVKSGSEDRSNKSFRYIQPIYPLRKKEWYTKQMTELGACSTRLLTLTIKTKML